MEIALFLVFPVLAAIAAIYDAASMTIPNWLNAVIAALFIPVALAAHWSLPAIGTHLALGVVVFLIGAGLFFAKVMGGGDVKMIAACSVWVGLPISSLLGFLAATAIAGGVLAAFALVARRITPAGLSEAGWARWLTERRAGLPYGVAIAVGGVFAWMNSDLGASLQTRFG
ncbi:MAG: prepilin peptidase [Caulobacterales bacterium]